VIVQGISLVWESFSLDFLRISMGEEFGDAGAHIGMCIDQTEQEE
jgi:hypothetical protein